MESYRKVNWKVTEKLHGKLQKSYLKSYRKVTWKVTEKLFEKYTSLAKEAMSSGDKTLSENYLQHADHFMRIIEDKNKNRNQAKNNIIYKPSEENKDLSSGDSVDQKSKVENNN